MECFLYPPGRSLGGAHTYRTVVRLVIGMVHSDIQTESKVTKTTGDCCDLRRKTRAHWHWRDELFSM